jgi:2'-5' RNA ligase
VRAFLALEIDEAIRDALARAQRTIGDAGAKVRWVAPENLHLTLHFLGEVADEALAEVCDVVAAAAAEVRPFEFRVRGVAPVPPRGRSLRMIWAGVDDPTGRLAELHAALGLALEGLGFRQERRAFRPHITMARVKLARNPDALRRAAAAFAETDFGTRLAEEVVAFSSQLTRSGAVYTAMARAPLGR